MNSRDGEHPAGPTPCCSPGHQSGAPDRQCPARYPHLVRLVEGLSTPVTMDRVVDAVVEQRGADCAAKSWHDVHEELYLVDLPVLDATDQLEFDDERGIVDSGN